METTNKEACCILVELLCSHGVRKAVVSPGSRNAPLLVALARCKEIEKYVVVDERSAAFMALGMAQQTGEPVAIVCTSGTALLDYSPAVAEAYYQKLPLIVISADRPKEWIDQDDSQTIRQFEALSQFVKKSYDLPARCGDDTARWYVNRIVNDALMEATMGMRAPVHINVELDEPLSELSEYSQSQRVIRMVQQSPGLRMDDIAHLVDLAKGRKILVIAGFHAVDDSLKTLLQEFATFSNVVVATETISNLGTARCIEAIDRTLLAIPSDDEAVYRPDLLITLGGAIVSRKIKEFLRRYAPAMHWHVGITATTVDCMQSLTMRIQTAPVDFFRQFVAEYKKVACGNSSFSELWHKLYEKGLMWHNAYLKAAGWSDMKAFEAIVEAMPADCRLQLSNGTTIRYMQLFGDKIRVPNFCNRGVSGIDGSTSTALGASLVYDGTTVLITGDISFSYDLSGLASKYNSPKFRIIVICNGGGGIFRFIKSTSMLPELHEYFEVGCDLPLAKYADAFGLAYFEASDDQELKKTLPRFFSHAEKASLLAVHTDNLRSAEILKNYFDRNKN